MDDRFDIGLCVFFGLVWVGVCIIVAAVVA